MSSADFALVTPLLRSTLTSATAGSDTLVYTDSANKSGLFAAVASPSFAYTLLKKGLVQGCAVGPEAASAEALAGLVPQGLTGAVLLVDDALSNASSAAASGAKTVVCSNGAAFLLAKSVYFSTDGGSKALASADAEAKAFSKYSFSIVPPHKSDGKDVALNVNVAAGDTTGTMNLKNAQALAGVIVDGIVSRVDTSKAISVAFANVNQCGELEFSVFVNDVVSLLRKTYAIVNVSMFATTEDDLKPVHAYRRSVEALQGGEVYVWEAAPAFQAQRYTAEKPVAIKELRSPRVKEAGGQAADVKFGFGNHKAFIQAIQGACHSVLAAEPEITRMDTIGGDGDAGETLALAANITLDYLKSIEAKGFNVPQTLSGLSEALERGGMGGTSGGLYRIYLSSLAVEASKLPAPSGTESEAKLFAEALQNALTTLLRFTRARKGDRTLLDPLIPFTEELKKLTSANEPTTQAFKEAEAEAVKGYENTKKLKASVGRASYVDEDRLANVGDAGARGILAIFEGIKQVLFPTIA